MPPKKKAKVAASDASAGSAVATNAGALSMTGADHADGLQPKKSRSRTARAVAATTRVTRSRSAAVAAGTVTAAPKVHHTIPPKVKATPAQKRVARLTAPLEDLPLDVLTEIFSVTHPRDLLALAQTSKPFRSFLMSRKSLQCWKTARESVEGYPPCPPFLSEPQLANLIYGLICDHCGCAVVDEEALMFFARYCKTCRPQFLRLPTSMGHVTAPVRKVTQDNSGMRYCAIPYLSSERIRGYSFPDGTYMLSETYYYVPEVERFRKAWASCNSNDEKKQLVKRCTAEVADKAKFFKAIKASGNAEARKEAQRLQELTEKHVEDVLLRLKEEACGEELSLMNSSRLNGLRSLGLVRKAEVLTDDGWRTIREDLIAQVETYRTARLRDEWFAVVHKRLMMLRKAVDVHSDSSGPRNATSDLRAEFADLALMPAFQQVLEVPVAETVTEHDIAKLCDSIAVSQEVWLQERKRELEELVVKKLKLAPSKNVSPLSLAIATFNCEACGRGGLRWPNILAHRCGRGSDHEGDYERALTHACTQLQLRLPWRRGRPFRATTVCKQTQGVIRTCGYDPRVVTYDEMQACNVRLYCKICSVSSVGYMEAYTWRSAASHCLPRCDIEDPLSVEKPKKWEVLDASTTASVILLEAARRDAGDVRGGIFSCTRCPYRSRGFPISHCKQVHSIKNPAILKDFYLHPETPDVRSPILVYPEDARADRRAARDVKNGRAFFSPSLFNDASATTY